MSRPQPEPAEESAAEPSALDLVRADPRLQPRDDDGVLAILIGTVLWVVALVVLLLGHVPGIDQPKWTQVCLIGALLGIPGLLLVGGRRRRRRASTQE